MITMSIFWALVIFCALVIGLFAVNREWPNERK